MKKQIIPRFGLIIHPEKHQVREGTFVLLIRLFSLLFCLAVWYGVYKFLKAVF